MIFEYNLIRSFMLKLDESLNHLHHAFTIYYQGNYIAKFIFSFRFFSDF